MITTRKLLNVFLLEDNPDDAELEIHELRKGGFDVSFEVSRNRKEFLEKLSDIDADIILADYALPDITGIEAIHICQEKKIDIPIIFITGVGSEQIAVDSLREGAIDYILKKHIVSLPARVSRALEIWAERKAKEKAEAEREQFQQLLLQAQKMESVGRLASGVAHDFNNILTGVLGFSELILQDTPKDSPDYERLETISTLCKKGAALIRQLLIFSRRMPIEFKKINLNPLIEDTKSFIRHVVGEGVEIRLNLQDDIPEISADTGQLTQVLINLALNATDAMDGKGILEFKTERYHTKGHVGRADECICLSVSDTGCGIPDYDIPKIFDPFFTTKDVGKGTGLGLAIVYAIVNAHGGWINVHSELGKGTAFKIYLPAIQPELADLT
jgi:two-component system cell cycle sensor histidine kinase/response regulator CckA